MIGKGATPSFFAIANDNYTLTLRFKQEFRAASSGDISADVH